MPRISQLPSLTTVDTGDELAVVDVSASVTKKSTKSDLLKDSIGSTELKTGAVTGVKIASYKALRQDNTTNSTENTARILTGWGYIQGAAATTGTKAIVFNGAFSSAPIVICTVVGIKTSVPTSVGDTTGGVFGGTVQGVSSTTTGFTATYYQAASVPTNIYVVFTWIAIGV
jgi:hypothetical protein